MLIIFFYFLKIIFDINTSKRSKKYKPHLILANFFLKKFNQTQIETQNQTVSNWTRESKACLVGE